MSARTAATWQRACIAAITTLLSGCGPAYMVAAYDARWSFRGPMAAAISGTKGESGAVAVGVGTRDVSLEAWLHAHNVASNSLALPTWKQDTGLTVDGSRHLGASASLLGRLGWFRKGPVTLSFNAGPTRALLVDRMTGTFEWALGYRYGTGAELAIGPFTAAVGAYRGEIYFSSGAAAGHSTLLGTTVSLALSR